MDERAEHRNSMKLNFDQTDTLSYDREPPWWRGCSLCVSCVYLVSSIQNFRSPLPAFARLRWTVLWGEHCFPLSNDPFWIKNSEHHSEWKLLTNNFGIFPGRAVAKLVGTIRPAIFTLHISSQPELLRRVGKPSRRLHVSNFQAHKIRQCAITNKQKKVYFLFLLHVGFSSNRCRSRYIRKFGIPNGRRLWSDPEVWTGRCAIVAISGDSPTTPSYTVASDKTGTETILWMAINLDTCRTPTTAGRID